ncbi:MAG: hypothetical protein K1X51_12505 [Rhodospirillaceae bacterium]|nr:hypothetical protein [Rhodospirillaceae bacterium]
MTAVVDVVPGRSCDACTLCCKVIGVPELAKPQGHDCRHCDTGRGCRIYDRRPAVCADFYCSYLLSPALGDEWKPLTSHLVLGYMADADVILIYTDPGHPGMWRRAPYLARIKKWAAATDKGYVLIWEKDRALALLNDDEFDLGKLYDGQVIVRDADAAGKATIYAADRPGS